MIYNKSFHINPKSKIKGIFCIMILKFIYLDPENCFQMPVSFPQLYNSAALRSQSKIRDRNISINNKSSVGEPVPLLTGSQLRLPL